MPAPIQPAALFGGIFCSDEGDWANCVLPMDQAEGEN